MQLKVLKIIEILKKATINMVAPGGSIIVEKYGRDPFLVLVSCILSLRTKDIVSVPASERLFEHAKTPAQLLQLSVSLLQKIIYPVGFYKKKSQQLKEIALQIEQQWDGHVSSNETDLLSLPGVGRKTMNLVRAEGFGIPAICVDVHVHRISNRLGLVCTKTPEETEYELKKIIPQQYWIEYSRLLVMWGQNICTPVLPKCSICPLLLVCPQIGVTSKR